MINFTPFSAPSGLTSKNAITILYGCFPFSLFAASLRGQTLEVILYNRSMPDKRDVKNVRGHSQVLLNFQVTMVPYELQIQFYACCY
jgi:hypothetical protein